MKKTIFILFFFSTLTAFVTNPNESPKPDSRLYEMRVYYAEPDKLNDLIARFRDHTTRLFEKHGMTNEAYFTPIENKDNKLVYVLSYKNKENREKSWKAFLDDPDWKKAAEASEKNGKLITKIDAIFLKTTDFSPKKIAKTGTPNRVFELRTYKATPNHLPNLLARFRNHTTKLFSKYEMTNLWYWTFTEKEQGADDMLIYFLAHPSQEAGLEAFKKFGNDADWQTVRKASEEKAGSSLTEYVKSEYMTATDFSPIK
ncbi:MAG: NIPSNAP family protein [Verrucomicrobia bacterium]|nr:NIPSNAP family protein [Cytophagales bacterium]